MDKNYTESFGYPASAPSKGKKNYFYRTNDGYVSVNRSMTGILPEIKSMRPIAHVQRFFSLLPVAGRIFPTVKGAENRPNSLAFVNSFFRKASLIVFLAAVIVFLPRLGLAQIKSIGTPSIVNYSRLVYNAGTQNWGITQDRHGFMYFANNEGVLRFDGHNWELTVVSQASPVRSVYAGKNNRIYAGLFNDFGLLQKNQSGRLAFRSLRHLLPDSLIQFDDIWKIHETAQGIIFQSFEYLFLLREDKIEVIKPQHRYHFSFQVNERLFLHEPGHGLFEFFNGNISKVPWADALIDAEINTILELRDNHLLIGTRENGIFKFENGSLSKWNTAVGELVEKNRLFSATVIPENYFAFGTILDGIIISDLDGKIIQHINRKRGLQNNTILSTFCDRENNLWLGLDNGIAYIEINSPVSYISDNEELGTGYCSRIFDGKLYVGTNQGLFVKSFNNFGDNNLSFELIENTAGQVWSLDVFDDQLICGHNSGTFVIRDRQAVKISGEEGGWKYIRLRNHPDLLLGGHYNGLVLLKKVNNTWDFHKKIMGFNESSRFIFQDANGLLWISHGGKGVFSVQLNESADSVIHSRLYTKENGLPSDERNILFTFREEAYISGINGIYGYQQPADSFTLQPSINELLPVNGQLLTLETDNQGNLWFISDLESGVFRRNEDMNYTKITTPFKQLDGNYVNGFEFIYPFNNDHVFFGLNNGFAHYSSKIIRSYAEKFFSYFTRVELPYLDSVIYIDPENPVSEINVPFRRNAFRFHYSAPFYKNLEQLQFSYFLKNYSEEWSDWSTDRYRDFTNLPEGDYVLEVKARNIYGIESEIAAFKFNILPPWHRSRTAYYTYLALFILLAYATFKLARYRIEKSRLAEKLRHASEMQKKEEQMQHQALVAEREIIRLRNEKLQNEMLHRDKELANQTMNIIDKNKSLMQIREDIQQLLKSTNDIQIKSRLALLNKKLVREIDNKQQNKIFETYFDEVHEDFFQHLKQKYPDISPREMKLCAYLRMNLTTKEIAALLNISDRGVEISRYRLRKKMNLSREISLSTYLSNI